MWYIRAEEGGFGLGKRFSGCVRHLFATPFASQRHIAPFRRKRYSDSGGRREQPGRFRSVSDAPKPEEHWQHLGEIDEHSIARLGRASAILSTLRSPHPERVTTQGPRAREKRGGWDPIAEIVGGGHNRAEEEEEASGPK